MSLAGTLLLLLLFLITLLLMPSNGNGTSRGGKEGRNVKLNLVTHTYLVLQTHLSRNGQHLANINIKTINTRENQHYI